MYQRLAKRVFKASHTKQDLTHEFEHDAETPRASERVNTYRNSVLYQPDGSKQNIIIHDMSETGLRIGLESGNSLPDYVDVVVMGQRYRCVVIWRKTFEAGLEYYAAVE